MDKRRTETASEAAGGNERERGLEGGVEERDRQVRATESKREKVARRRGGSETWLSACFLAHSWRLNSFQHISTQPLYQQLSPTPTRLHAPKPLLDSSIHMKLVQGDMNRLTKTHMATAHSVNKLLERSRKVGDSMKEVKERMDKQGTMVKRLETNHHNLLKRNHFKVLIFQVSADAMQITTIFIPVLKKLVGLYCVGV